MRALTEKEKKLNVIRLILCAVCLSAMGILGVYNLTRLRFPAAKTSDAASAAFIYIATALPFLLFSVLAAAKKSLRKAVPVLFMFALSYVVRIGFADFKSIDYTEFLSKWVEEYRQMPLGECFTKQVGNYPPLYNYFLILFSRLPVNDLYLIKTLSFYGEVVTAVFAVKIVAAVKREPFHWLWLGILLLMPVYMTNSSQWGQCDTLYVMCAVAGIYFALCRKSLLCCALMGLGLAFKMQVILLYPVCLILLLVKDEDGRKYLRWRDIWIAPLVFFVVSGIPVFFGGSFFKSIEVFFNQMTAGNGAKDLNGHCPNLLLPFIGVPKDWAVYYVILAFFLLVTAAVDTFVVVHALKSSRFVLSREKIVFLCVFLPLVSVFFMPKMLDRFFYLAEIFSFIYFAIRKDKNSLTAYIALETGVWMMYVRFLLRTHPVAWCLSPLFTFAAVIWQTMRFFEYFPPPEKWKRKKKIAPTLPQ